MNMRRHVETVTMLVLFAFGSPSCPDQAKKQGLELDGTWQAIKAASQGEVVLVNDMRVTFKDAKVIWRSGDNIYREDVFKLDPTKSPKTIDFTTTSEGSFKGNTLEGIYRLDGDRLTICTPSFPGVRERPTEFKARTGSRTTFVLLQRVACPFELRGLIRNVVNGRSLAKVRVRLVNSEGSNVADPVLTDEKGEFEMSFRLNPTAERERGDWKLLLSRDGFETENIKIGRV